MNKKKKIVFFLKEYRFSEQYFSNLIKKLEAGGFHIVILHSSKLEKTKVDNALFENIDISYLSSFKLKKILRRIDPKTIIITNVRSLLDINLIVLSNILRIKLTYVEHGLTLKKIIVFKKSNLFHSVKKYSVYLFNSLANILLTKKFLSVIKMTLNPFLRNDYSNLLIDNFLFYSHRSREVMESLFDLSKSKVFYSGYPIIENKNKKNELETVNVENTIVFVHQPLIIDKFLNLSVEEEVKVYNEINAIVTGYGYRFILKIHPRSSNELYKNLFKGEMAKSSENIETLIAKSNLVIGYFSTALLTALILKKKILIFKHKDIVTNEIATFVSENNSFGTMKELDSLIKNLKKNTFIPEQIDVKKYAGITNTHQDRFSKLLEILK
jgi:hypothetical protein